MKLGIIGFGNMGSAIARALKSKAELWIYDKDPRKRQAAIEEGFAVPNNSYFLTKNCDLLILAVKPQDIKNVINEIKDITKGKLVISIAAGIDLDFLYSTIGNRKVVRLMPSVNTLVGKGAIAIAFGEEVNEEEKKLLKDLFSSCGNIYEIPEYLFDSFTALAGSGPAFVFSFIEALALAGVREGFEYETALKIVLDTVEGSVSLIKEKKGSPNEWITKVTSPGGTTIEGISYLEKKGFKGLIIECIRRTSEKAGKLKS